MTNKLESLPNVRAWWLWTLASGFLGLLIGALGQVAPATLVAQFSFDKFLNASGNGLADAIAFAAGEVYSPKFAVAITLISAGLVWWLGKSRLDAIAVVAIIAFGWLPAEAFKLLINEARPNQSELSHLVVAQEIDNAFPSGHVCFAIAFGYAMFLLAKPTRLRTLVAVLWPVSVLVMAWARLYSGVHYATDVLGSVFASMAGLVLLGFIWNKAVAALKAKA